MQIKVIDSLMHRFNVAFGDYFDSFILWVRFIYNNKACIILHFKNYEIISKDAPAVFNVEV